MDMKSRTSAAASPVALVALLAVALGGCAFGRTIAYNEGGIPKIDASGTNSVAVAAHDQRPLITSGRENPTLVGERRSLHHIPYGVNTSSDRPMADDFAEVLAKALSARGFKATPVFVSHRDSWNSVVRKVKAAQADRCVVLTIDEWRTDTYFNTQLFFSLTLKVLDQDGKLLAEQQVAGHTAKLPVSPVEAFRQKIEELIKPDVASALTLNQSAEAPPKPVPPTTSASPDIRPADATPAGQLQRLKDLHDKGLITDDVYKEKMREILNGSSKECVGAFRFG